ncbi:hypothetical protein DF17_33025 [Streptomyces rimosus]|nr:hypothetical protein DF17_33025 [Streptomyces rimosus]
MMAQLAIHCAQAATPSAAARILFGNISPRKTHTTTPQDRAKKSTKEWAAIRATVPCAVGSVSPVFDAKAHASRASETAIPAEPISASGRRPILSTKIIAITVPMMLMIEVVKL